VTRLIDDVNDDVSVVLAGARRQCRPVIGLSVAALATPAVAAPACGGLRRRETDRICVCWRGESSVAIATHVAAAGAEILRFQSLTSASFSHRASQGDCFGDADVWLSVRQSCVSAARRR